MTTVAIIAEYNPPHLGHAYLVKCVREHFGEDTRVIALMSGSYVQRGDIAICDGYARGEMALDLGVDLILELPFPYSLATAEKYATAAIRLLQKLGCVDYLAFGSECGNLEDLYRIAEFTLSEEYLIAQGAFYQDEKNEGRSFASLRSALISSHLDGITNEFLRSPNNILAIEYLRAILKENAGIKPFTIRRLGSYHDHTDNQGFPSASKIREYIFGQNYDSVKESVPFLIWQRLNSHLQNGSCPASLEAIDAHLIIALREKINMGKMTSEMDESLQKRILSILPTVTTFQELILQVKAKHYTEAHIRRTLLFAYFGITSADLDTPPEFTRVLAANSKGCSLLKNIKRIGQIPVLTKTADYRARLDGVALRQAEISFFADSIYNLCLAKPQSAAEVFKKTPFIGK